MARLIATSFITTVFSPPAEFEAGGEANGRAPAYLAHEFLGDGFGTVYDLSSILEFGEPSCVGGLAGRRTRREISNQGTASRTLPSTSVG